MSPDKAAKELVHRFEMESMALHRIQREWLEREIAKLLATSFTNGVQKNGED